MTDIKLNILMCVPVERISFCSAYKGQFDGHTWWAFYGNLSSPTVVHDPLCSCTKKQ